MTESPLKARCNEQPEKGATPMGDKKGKKDKAKEHRQTDAKHTQAAKQKQNKQQPRTP